MIRFHLFASPEIKSVTQASKPSDAQRIRSNWIKAPERDYETRKYTVIISILLKNVHRLLCLWLPTASRTIVEQHPTNSQSSIVLLLFYYVWLAVVAANEKLVHRSPWFAMPRNSLHKHARQCKHTHKHTHTQRKRKQKAETTSNKQTESINFICSASIGIRAAMEAARSGTAAVA